MTEPLKLLSLETVGQLEQDISKNIERYESNAFTDLAKGAGWAIEATFAKWDPAIVVRLDPSGSPEAEIANSLLVFEGLKGMTPALAREERLWARLCHVECLEYVRERWLRGTNDMANQVKLHCFALGFTGCRDDNAIGRLWWNGYIASLASPDDVELGLRRLLSRANIRMQVIERADTAFRRPLLSGIFRILGKEGWFAADDKAIAKFMIEVNKWSGGVVFEAMSQDQIDAHLMSCINLAKEKSAESRAS